MMTTLLAFALILGPVIVFHEFGHFIVAKLAGIYVKTFSVGFGPKLLKWRWGETQYALSAIPMGGYVKMAGDSVVQESEAQEAEAPEAGAGGTDGEAEGRVGEEMLYPKDEVPDIEIPPHRYFRNKPLLTRLAVVTAGPFANLVLAIVVLTLLLWTQGQRVPPTTTLGEIEPDSAEFAAGLREGDRVVRIHDTEVHNPLEMQAALESHAEGPVPVVVQRGDRDTTIVLPEVRFEDGRLAFPRLSVRPEARIGRVKKDGPADRAGLQPGDRIVAIDGEPVRYYDELADRINPAAGKPLEIIWERDGVRHTATVTPEPEEVPVSLTKTRRVGRIQIEPYTVVVPVGFGTAVREGFRRSWFITVVTARFLGELVMGRADRDAIGGPIRIGQEAGSALRWGPAVLFQLMAFLSVNLFLLNLLPIPVLDGGHVLFLAIEAVRGEALSAKAQERLLRVGVSALILLMGFVIVNDLVRVITG